MPELWHVQGHAWIVAADEHMVALDVAEVPCGKDYEDAELLWLTSAHPAHFSLSSLTRLPRRIRVVVDPEFPRVEAEAVEMLNFAVYRLGEPTIEVGDLKIIRRGDCMGVHLGRQTGLIHRSSALSGPCMDSSFGEVVRAAPGEPQLLTGQAVTAEESPRLLRLSETPRARFGLFPSDHEQRTAFFEVEDGLHRFGARLGCLLAAGHDERLATALAEGLTILIRGGPGERDFAFRYEVASYDFVPIPVPPKGTLAGNIMVIHLQDYWAVLKGDVLSWELLEQSIGSTSEPITYNGAGLAEIWCILHESRLEPEAVGTYYQRQTTALMNEEALALGEGREA